MSTAGAPSGSYNELKSKWSVFSSEMPSGWNWCLPAIQKTTCSSHQDPASRGQSAGLSQAGRELAGLIAITPEHLRRRLLKELHA